MKNIRILIIVLLSAPLWATVITACNSGSTKEEANYREFIDNDSIPAVLKNLVEAVYKNDASLFADQVSYPLVRPYPLKDITSAEEMQSYYNVLVDDSLRKVVLQSVPVDWQEFGWRGISLKDGEYIWLSDSVYAVNYVSKREQQLIDSLTSIERNSLPLQLREGWTPILTLRSEDNGTVYRVDELTANGSQESSLYRLCIYDYKGNSDKLKTQPDRLLKGEEKVEGSANIISYIFADNSGNEYIILPEDMSSGKPSITLPDGTSAELEKAYWYELLSGE